MTIATASSHCRTISTELNLRPAQVEAAAVLFDEGATVPFIARYRKEKTGSLDEVALQSIRDRLEQLAELDKRRESILGSLTERQLLTPELESAVRGASTLTVLEDLYLPYRPKRRTRAQMARERGLEPLANQLLLQEAALDPVRAAEAYVSEEKGVAGPEEALEGARDIIAEFASEHAEARQAVRAYFAAFALIETSVVKGKEEEGAKFRDWFDWREPATKAAGHRLLAIFRGENEGFLKVSIKPPVDKAQGILGRRFLKNTGKASEQVRLALEDGYDRLLAPSLETEFRAELKARADDDAIAVFASNLRELLMAAPLGQKNVLALDPGLRTGCKLVCLDRQAALRHHTVIYVTGSDRQREEAAATLKDLCARFSIEAIAVGNGTGSRETETLLRGLPFLKQIPVVMVNESGASIYSASEIARTEFPDQDVTVRGSVSIGRRLMDPLAELVKIDPKSIGVGQYQHDVDQKKLKRGLDDVVTSCVNAVGVEVNTASAPLLTYVAGVGAQLAANIVAWRTENGPFTSRVDLKKVPRLGPKAFEQCAGFLRVRQSENPLDASAVHPERYALVKRMAADLGCSVADLLSRPEARSKLDINKYISEDIGLPTLLDIKSELEKPGRDPRAAFEAFSFAEGVHKISDLRPGMKLPGIVTNVTRFGAFVDVGVHQDGLVHISELADRFVREPSEVVKVQQKVTVTVLEVDEKRSRISLSMRSHREGNRKSEV
ncbi:RNA-binding transcriptional accessory protein [Candidatus Ozemobacteraceae bacterium]|nr:RNA-binding transcriptional accessory protein [Candidatus Ozemobacteraceae bacterium]